MLGGGGAACSGRLRDMDEGLRRVSTRSRRRWSGRAAAGTALLAVVLLLPRIVAAQDLEPRSCTNLPIGLNFFVAGYQLSEGDVTTDAAVPLEDGEVRYHGPVFAYVRSIALPGRSARIDVIVPSGWVSGSATVLGEPREPPGRRAAQPVRRRQAGRRRHQPLDRQAGSGPVEDMGSGDAGARGGHVFLHRQRRLSGGSI